MNVFPCVVIDSGTSECKAGFAGEDVPQVVIPSVVGYSRTSRTEYYVGNETQERRDLLAMRYPISSGEVVNWDNAMKLWHHIFFNELRVAPQEQRVIATTGAMGTAAHLEKLTHCFFEEFLVRSMFYAVDGELSLLASGDTSGHSVVVQCGEGACHVVPIYSGTPLHASIKRLDITGRLLTRTLADALYANGIEIDDRTILRDMKQKLFYIALDFKSEFERGGEPATYVLPDGQHVKLGQERFSCPEAIFQPNLVDDPYPGVHDIVYKSVKGEEEGQKEMLKNVLLTGGTCNIPGMAARLHKELSNIVPKEIEINVTPPTHKYAAWVGGSMAASHSNFQHKFITNSEYEEHGPSIIFRKYF